MFDISTVFWVLLIFTYDGGSVKAGDYGSPQQCAAAFEQTVSTSKPRGTGYLCVPSNGAVIPQ